MPVPTVRSSSQTVGSANGTAHTGNVPPTVVAGDILLAFVGYSSGTKPTTPPAGWTEVSTISSSTSMQVTAYSKVATASEPASYTWTGSSRSAVVTILALADATMTGVVFAGSAGASRLAHTNPVVTTTLTDTLLISALAGGVAGGTYTQPTDYTVLNSAASTGTSPAHGAVAVLSRPTTGASPTGSWTSGAASTSAVLQLAVPSSSSNTSPVLTVGAHQNVHQGEIVTLTSSVVDPEGGVTGTWTQEFGPTVTLSSTTANSTTFTAPLETGTLIFRRDVSDSGGLTATGRTSVSVQSVDEVVWSGTAWS